MEPKRPGSLLNQLAKKDQLVLQDIIRRYPALTQQIYSYHNVQSLRESFEKERVNLNALIDSLRARVDILTKSKQEQRPADTHAMALTDANKALTARVVRLEREVELYSQLLRRTSDPVHGNRPESPLTAEDQADSLSWPWPITEPPETSVRSAEVHFPNEYSGLRLCGYRVGKAGGMQSPSRRLLLDHFFRNQLPRIVQRFHGDEYGEPGSEKRLRKMANVMAANCKNFKKIDRDKYGAATSDYEQDLGYLKRQYYRPGSFPWPEIEE